MKREVLLLAILVLLILGCNNNALEGPFKVTNVVDGDTLDLNNSKRVRLSGINTPETGECYYEEAKDKLTGLVLGKDVFLERDKTNIDKYGRTLRYIYSDGVLVNSVLVQEGFARVFDNYKQDTKKYEELKAMEETAKTNKLGIWSCEERKESCLYVGSKKSKTYHSPDCKWAKRIKPENLVCYKTESEVEQLTPCATCLQNK
ncbi:hypothetical protein FJZ53_03065 [Candidatus Woesearchaeota archaeon]|nr:hypothetical protein [Candidatus Woesearchaeota archaeon]